MLSAVAISLLLLLHPHRVDQLILASLEQFLGLPVLQVLYSGDFSRIDCLGDGGMCNFVDSSRLKCTDLFKFLYQPPYWWRISGHHSFLFQEA